MSVVERVTAANGYGYMRVDTTETATLDGAALKNHLGEMQGLLMSSPWLQRYRIGKPGDVYAIDTTQVAGTALPLLRSGHIDAELPIVPPGNCPPCLPLVIRGSITLDGKDAPAGSTLHARIGAEGQPDLWERGYVHESGWFILSFGCFPCGFNPFGYIGTAFEFWMNCRLSSTTATYDPRQLPPIQLDLAF